MRARTWIGGVAAAALVVLLLPVHPAAASSSFIQRDTDVDESVGLASNLNSPMVARVRRSDGHILFTGQDFDVIHGLDLGQPPLTVGGTVTRLAVSADHVFAVTNGGSLYEASLWDPHWSATDATGVQEVLASRDGNVITEPNEPSRLDPNVYVLSRTGVVSRRVGQSWSTIGSNFGQGTLVERGPSGSTRLYFRALHGSVTVWNGSGWDGIGRPTSQIAANLTSLMAIDRDTGTLVVLDDASRTFKSLAMPAGTTIPFFPGGRFWLGAHSIYYRPAGSTELWGVRFPPPSPAFVVLTPWILLSRTPILQVAGIMPTEVMESFALTDSGTMALVSWGVPVAAMPGTPYLTVGEDVNYWTAALVEWTGDLIVLGVTGVSVPGLTMNIRRDGILEVTGRPTAEGRFTSTITVADSTGATVDVIIDYQVHPSGTSGTSTSVFANPSAAVMLVNCGPDPSAQRGWYRDRTIAGGWIELPPMPPALVSTPSGWLCDPTVVTPTLVPVPRDHVVEIAAVIPNDTFCGGVDDPRVIACRRTFFVTGTDDPPLTIQL